jgi:hypothetical protein
MTELPTATPEDKTFLARTIFEAKASHVEFFTADAESSLYSPGATYKLGGLPYAEQGASWPKCPLCDAPLAFIGQFPDVNSDPASSMLQIFWCHKPYCQDDISRSPFEFNMTRRWDQPSAQGCVSVPTRRPGVPSHRLSPAGTGRICDIADIHDDIAHLGDTDLGGLIADIAKLSDDAPDHSEGGLLRLFSRMDHKAIAPSDRPRVIAEITLPASIHASLRGSGCLTIQADGAGHVAVSDEGL